jgi:GR25 family glycosyltransferase involved in LPS biosynthesis
MSFQLRTFVITLPECPQRTEACRAHLRERKLYDVTFFNGIHAEKFGLKTLHTYEVDNPGTNFSIGFKPTGIWLSHYFLWGALNLLWDEHFMVLEDDVKLPEDWHARINQAMNDVPRDFDTLYVGSCCVEGRPTKHVKGEVYECNSMLCTHAIIWAKKALPLLLETQRKVYGPIDCQLAFHSLPKLKSYVVLPRIMEQFDTVIPN